jgi:hypothetical protein
MVSRASHCVRAALAGQPQRHLDSHRRGSHRGTAGTRRPPFRPLRCGASQAVSHTAWDATSLRHRGCPRRATEAALEEPPRLPSKSHRGCPRRATEAATRTPPGTRGGYVSAVFVPLRLGIAGFSGRVDACTHIPSHSTAGDKGSSKGPRRVHCRGPAAPRGADCRGHQPRLAALADTVRTRPSTFRRKCLRCGAFSGVSHVIVNHGRRSKGPRRSLEGRSKVARRSLEGRSKVARRVLEGVTAGSLRVPSHGRLWMPSRSPPEGAVEGLQASTTRPTSRPLERLYDSEIDSWTTSRFL